jgi:hypothetical protein
LTILTSLISALSTSGSLILNLVSRQTHLASAYLTSNSPTAEPFPAKLGHQSAVLRNSRNSEPCLLPHTVHVVTSNGLI